MRASSRVRSLRDRRSRWRWRRRDRAVPGPHGPSYVRCNPNGGGPACFSCARVYPPSSRARPIGHGARARPVRRNTSGCPQTIAVGCAHAETLRLCSSEQGSARQHSRSACPVDARRARTAQEAAADHLALAPRADPVRHLLSARRGFRAGSPSGSGSVSKGDCHDDRREGRSRK